MQCSLTILSSVAAPLTLFITSKLVIPNIHERSCFRLQVARNISQRISVYHRACSTLFAFNLGASRWEWEQVAERMDINKHHRKKRGKITPLFRWDFHPVVCRFYARCCGFRDFHETLPLFFLPPAWRFFLSALVPHFFLQFPWWNIAENMSRWIYSLSKQWADAIMPRCSFLMIAAFFHVLPRNTKSAARSLRSTRLVSRNKSGGHAAVRLWWLILFCRFVEEQNPRCIISIYSGLVSVDKNEIARQFSFHERLIFS